MARDLAIPDAPQLATPSPRRHWSRLGLWAGMLAMALGGLLLAQGLFLRGKAVLAHGLVVAAWQRTLADQSMHKPWGWADFYPIGWLKVPAFGVDVPVFNAANGESMAFGPGLIHGSHPPGRGRVSVIMAHRNTQFQFLGRIKPGDVISLQRPDGNVAAYRMIGSEVVLWNRSGIDGKRVADLVALVTCWPVDTLKKGPERLVVWFEPVGKAPP